MILHLSFLKSGIIAAGPVLIVELWFVNIKCFFFYIEHLPVSKCYTVYSFYLIYHIHIPQYKTNSSNVRIKPQFLGKV